MKFFFIILLLSSILFSDQKQLILGSFSNKNNAAYVLKNLNEYIEKNEKLKSLVEKYSLKTMNTFVSGYTVVSISPFESDEVINELREALKSKYQDIYSIQYPTKAMLENEVSKDINSAATENSLEINKDINNTPTEQIHKAIVKETKKDKITPIIKKKAYKESKEFKEAVHHYKNNDYENSYNILSKIYLDHLNDPGFNFAFGKSAYEVGEYEVALSAFERVEMLDPSNILNKLEMARTYYMLQMFEDSQYAYEDVLASPNIDESVRKNIEFALSKVQRVQKKSFTYAKVMVDAIYDSNVNYGSIDDYEYRGATLQKKDSMDDVALQASANIVNIYDIGDKNGFAVRNSLSVYNKSYLEFDKYDLLYFSYFPSLLYKETKYTAEAAIGFDSLYLGSEEYLNSFSVVPSIQYLYNPTLKFLSHLKYQRKEFQDKTLSVLDADKVEFSLGLQKVLTPRSYILGNILAIDESKVRGDALNVDFLEYKSNLTYVNQFLPSVTASLFTEAKLRDYDDYSVGFGSTRKDVGIHTNLTLNYTIFPFLVMRIRGNYEYVNSNQEFFSYEKFVLSAGLVKTF